MSMRINTNVAAMNAYRNLSVTEGSMSKSLEKLSSGLRINRAADDAAGLAISEGLRSQVGGLKVAVRNAQDGVSVVQTAEGALTEVHAILQRMRDLAVQGANDSNSDKARQAIGEEVTALNGELTRIASSTNFNGTNLLDGSAATLNFQVGADGSANSRIAVDLSSANVSTVATNLSSESKAVMNFDVEELAAAETLVFSNGAGAGADVTITLGATGFANQGELAATLNGNTEFANAYSASVTQNGQLQVVSKLGGTVAVTGTGATAVTDLTATTAALDFSTHAGAQSAIGTIDAQIESVSSARASLGAVQNRFEHTIKNLNVAVENLSASESRIRDTDMASEMVNFTKSQILSQAGTAMLAQANQSSQGVLSLLR
jgi:flagellin